MLRSEMIRIASELPKGDPTRRKLLASLKAGGTGDARARAVAKMEVLVKQFAALKGVRSAHVDDFRLEEGYLVDGVIHIYVEPEVGGRAGRSISALYRKIVKARKRDFFSSSMWTPRQNFPSQFPKGAKEYGVYYPPDARELERAYQRLPYTFDFKLYTED